MAVVKDYYVGNTHIRIHDDAYADLTPEELAAREKHIQQRISQIVREHFRKKMEEGSA